MVLHKIPTFGEVKNWVNANADVPHADHADNASAVGGVLADDLGIPSGVITMWSGSTSNVPSGWSLCNGNNGTPDLRNRFIVGAGSGYSVGNTGGQSSVSLSVDEMPSHSHRAAVSGEYNQSDGLGRDGSTGDGYSNRAPGGDRDFIESTGGDQAHENRPPFYALAYIMKN